MKLVWFILIVLSINIKNTHGIFGMPKIPWVFLMLTDNKLSELNNIVN